jgi:hypothetical protein
MRIKDCVTVADLLACLDEAGSPAPADPCSDIVQKAFELGVPLVRLGDAVQQSEGVMERFRTGEYVPHDIMKQSVVVAIRDILSYVPA